MTGALEQQDQIMGRQHVRRGDGAKKETIHTVHGEGRKKRSKIVSLEDVTVSPYKGWCRLNSPWMRR